MTTNTLTLTREHDSSGECEQLQLDAHGNATGKFDAFIKKAIGNRRWARKDALFVMRRDTDIVAVFVLQAVGAGRYDNWDMQRSALLKYIATHYRGNTWTGPKEVIFVHKFGYIGTSRAEIAAAWEADLQRDGHDFKLKNGIQWERTEAAPAMPDGPSAQAEPAVTTTEDANIFDAVDNMKAHAIEKRAESFRAWRENGRHDGSKSELYRRFIKMVMHPDHLPEYRDACNWLAEFVVEHGTPCKYWEHADPALLQYEIHGNYFAVNPDKSDCHYFIVDEVLKTVWDAVDRVCDIYDWCINEEDPTTDSALSA